MERTRVKTVFIMLFFCSMLLLSGCQEGLLQGKDEHDRRSEKQEVYRSNIGFMTADLYRKAEDLDKQYLLVFLERRFDTYDWNQIYADYKMELEEDAMDLLLYLDVIKDCLLYTSPSPRDS